MQKGSLDSDKGKSSMQASPGTQLDLEARKRKREWIFALILASLFAGLTVVEFRLANSSSTVPFANSLVFFGLLNLNLILIITIIWLVFRNIGKIFLERRRQVLGARLKTKLVIAFLSLSIIPTLLLFIISAIYINSSFDRWFSIKIQNTLEASLEITRDYYRNANETAHHFAEHIAAGMGTHFERNGVKSFVDLPVASTPMGQWIQGFLREKQEMLVLESVEYYPGPLDGRVHVYRAEMESGLAGFPPLSFDLIKKGLSGVHLNLLQHLAVGDVMRSSAPVIVNGHNRGMIVVSSFLSKNLQERVGEIANVVDDYRDVNPLRYPMKTTFLVILILMTLVILFVAIWIGLYLAKELTQPVEKLVAGAHAVGAGNLDVEIEKSGQDELAVLVESFNLMTRDLRLNREKLDEASRDIEKRRQQLEAVLANVATGILVVDRQGTIRSYNRAVEEILGVPSTDVVGQLFARKFPEVFEELKSSLVLAFDLRGSSGRLRLDDSRREWTYKGTDRTRILSAALTPLFELADDIAWGVVIAIDDISEAVKGQREMAWREVARRIAHEIKNPLTPIKLSAQRIQRRLGVPGRPDDLELLQECTETIILHTDELRDLVNEFSEFARLPEANPALNDLNQAAKEVLALYEPAHADIQFVYEPEVGLPQFEFDREQIKRVLINLLENSVAALGHQASSTANTAKPGQILVRTRLEPTLGLASLQVRDNGPGVPEEILSRIFEPYFSTKSEGTGLGLAIAKRIINDHHGVIRVNSLPGGGTEFLIELPIARRTQARMEVGE
jgi:two-component system nitrogen regulation sensor histidine kinase NtrY